MDAKGLYDEIVDFCNINADEATIIKYSKYFKEGYDAYGLNAEIFKTKVDELIASRAINWTLLNDAAPLLFESGKYEETSFVLALTEKLNKSFDIQIFNDIEKWFDLGITNWAHSDFLCGNILSWFFLKKIVPLDSLKKWRISDKKYQRRCVPVTMIKLLKKSDDYSPFFEMIDPLMLDHERVVHQGLGWFLREAWKLKPSETEDFLLKWKNHAARLIFQYATEKMEKHDRLRFKKEK